MVVWGDSVNADGEDLVVGACSHISTLWGSGSKESTDWAEDEPKALPPELNLLQGGPHPMASTTPKTVPCAAAKSSHRHTWGARHIHTSLSFNPEINVFPTTLSNREERKPQTKWNTYRNCTNLVQASQKITFRFSSAQTTQINAKQGNSALRTTSDLSHFIRSHQYTKQSYLCIKHCLLVLYDPKGAGGNHRHGQWVGGSLRVKHYVVKPTS